MAGQLLFGRFRVGIGIGLWRQLFELMFHDREIGIDCFVEKAALGAIEAFVAATKLPALQNSDLMGQLIDLGFAIQKFAGVADDEFLTLGEPDDQVGRQRTQLRSAQGIELVRIHHTPYGANR